MLYAPHLGLCFGLGDPDRRAHCPCPPTCRRLCALIRLDPARSPRHERGRGRFRPYTPVPNDLTGPWNPPGQREPSDSVKLTYIFLIQRTLKTRPRWVVHSMSELSQLRGISLKAFRQHCGALKRLGFIDTVPYRLLSDDYNMNEHAILLLDAPQWYRTPADIKVDLESCGGADDHGDDINDEVDAHGDIDDEACARPRRGVDLDKVRRHLAQLRRCEVVDAA